MNRIDIEDQVLDTLRRTALRGSRRAIGPDEPLGDLGVGLDSLALIDFATAIEKRFQIQLPDDLWVERGRLTLGCLSDWMHQSVSSSTLTVAEAWQPPAAQQYAQKKAHPPKPHPPPDRPVGISANLAGGWPARSVLFISMKSCIFWNAC
ncbi:MAG TPA: acyl carrier protein [bacterium]|nr:acyl carrier protein [bacterium]